MHAQQLYAVCIQRAAQQVGGYDALGALLHVPPEMLARWGRGEGVAAKVVFLKVVDILMEHRGPPL